jgi:transposase
VIPSSTMSTNDSLPDDVETLKRLLLASNAELAQARAEAASAAALVMHLRLMIEKLKRDLFGARNERKARLIDQMELQLEELEAAATEDEVAAEQAVAASSETTQVRTFTRRRPARKPFPAYLPRERVIVPGPRACRTGSPSSVRT